MPNAPGPQAAEQPTVTPQTAAGAAIAPSPGQPGLTQTPGTGALDVATPDTPDQSATHTTLPPPDARAASAPFQNQAAASPAPSDNGTPTPTTELTDRPLAAANPGQATSGTSAAQAATEAPAQAAAVSTAAQASLASLDAGISPNPEASADVAASPSAGANPLPVSGVPMQEMIDSIGATIELAARQGIARARIELQPEELGHISIRLSQTSEGLRARVTADTPAGAQALTQGRSELRQSLSSLGLSLLRLDIGSSGQPQTGEQDGRFAAKADGSSAAATAGAPEENEVLGDPRDDTRPAGTPLGEIVDVLA
jgi:chemotaxis protein MotD